MDRRIESAIQIVRERFPEASLSVTNVALRVSLSRSRLEHLLRQETGQTFRQYVRELRLAEGKRLLLKSTLQVKEVAFRVGYSSSAAFVRAFRRGCGLTPSMYGRQRPAEDERRRHIARSANK